MPRFSANLGFLWKELSLPDAIRAASRAGFDGVECHWPYEENLEAVQLALLETGLPMISINTKRGDGAGSFGLAALPDRENEARAAVDEALEWAKAIDAGNVHVMAGVASGPTAHAALIGNLQYACAQALPHEITILIEPLNSHDAPGYFYSTTQKALSILQEVNAGNMKLMFDCYHVGRMEASDAATLLKRFNELRRHIGHIQFAAVPDRGPPDHGAIDYTAVFNALDAAGWDKPLGAEYVVDGATEDSFDWIKAVVGNR